MRTWLKELREEAGDTQDTFAKKLGIPTTTYASIEQGHRNPSVKLAIRMAEVIGCDWTLFFKDVLLDSSREVG